MHRNELIWNGSRIDLSWARIPELESCIKFWANVLLSGVINAMWREVEITKFEVKNGKKYRIVYTKWVRDEKDREWVMSHRRTGNDFQTLCELTQLGLSAEKIRERIDDKPPTFYDGVRVKIRTKLKEDVCQKTPELMTK